MPLREFNDADGVGWRVWATTPTLGNVRPQFAGGWLAFESRDERRRLAPVPEAWAEVDDGALRELLAQAVVVARDSSAMLKRTDAGTGALRAGSALHATVAKVREVIRTVEESLHRKPAG
jgi:hypothetical protein